MNVAVYLLWTAAILFPGELPRLFDDLAFPFSVFALGVLALRHNEDIGLAAMSQGAARERPAREADEGLTAEKYARSGLTPERAAALRSRLDHLMMTEKQYLNSDLSLADLADRLGISTHHLSQLLNEELQATFYDYVNRLRVEEVRRMMSDPAHQDEKILSLAFSAGFNSKAAFNAAFKRLTGCTPREYRQKLSPPTDSLG
jgi:AraC-like DNA-binding protein